MANAYSPGLTVSAGTIVERTRRLPIKGEVAVAVGDNVLPTTVVARAMLPGLMQSVKAANILGIDASEVEPSLKVKLGDHVDSGQILAETASFFGLFKSECKSLVGGVFETFSHANGSIGIRLPSTPVEVNAYVSGKVVEIIPREGVVVETNASLVQGIFGIGGERTGVLRLVVDSADVILTDKHIDESCAGCIVIGGSLLTSPALRAAANVGVKGIVCGGIVDGVLKDFLGYDIGVAITGDEAINLSLVITEGFGNIPMAARTFELLKSLNGKAASINGSTQIRAGVIRPEVIVPKGDDLLEKRAMPTFELSVGCSIRIIREPYFGLLGSITSLPPQLQTVESGASVRTLNALLADGRTVTVPRANVEMIETV
jgi:hypothetical protein